MKKLEVRAVAAPWHRGVDVLIRQGDAIGVNVTMQVVSEGYAAEPTFTMDHTQAQTLMDDLWNAGLRPTEGTGSAGSLRATERHLEDMRKLVFKHEG